MIDKIIFTHDLNEYPSLGGNNDLRPRLRKPSSWFERAFDYDKSIKIMKIPINLMIAQLASGFVIHEFGTWENPNWWSGLMDRDVGPNIIEILPAWLLERLRNKTALVHYDQSLEGFPLITSTSNFYENIHKLFEQYNIPPEQFVITTCNLLEDEIYQSWCDSKNITNRMTIMSIMFFGIIGAEDSFFGSGTNDLTISQHMQYKQDNQISLFNSLNRVLREHRIAMNSMLNYYNLVDTNKISQDKFPYHFWEEFNSIDYTHHPAFESANIKDINAKLPLVLDISQFDVNQAQHFFSEIYLTTWLSVITETYYSESTNETVFFSEKIFKPMRARHPFILVAPPSYLKELRKAGFKTFSDFWDESYDDIIDNTERMDCICKLLTHLSTLSKDEWMILYNKMIPILEHNMYTLRQTNWTKNIEPYLRQKIGI
jgi:hypothetical protein